MKKSIFSIILLAAAIIPASANEITDTLNTAVVTGTRVSTLRDQVVTPVSVVSRNQIQATEENSLLPSLMEQVPSLFVTSRGVTGYGVSGGAGGGISLRGFGAGNGRVLILIDGHPQFMSIYGHPVADEYMAPNVQRVEVSRGAASVLYGSNAMGGAINIITAQPEKDGNTFSAKIMGGSYGTVRAVLTDSYRQGKFHMVTSAQVDSTKGHRTNSSFSNLGVMSTVGYDFSDSWSLSGRVSVMHAYSQNPGTVAEPMFDAWSNVTRGMTGISLSNRFEKTSGTVDLYYKLGKHDINDGYKEGGAPQPFLFHSTDYIAGVTAYQTVDVFEGNSLTVGTDVLFYGGNAFRNPETEIYADHKKLNEEAVYMFDNQTWGAFTFNAGLRLDRHSAYGIKWIPQAGMSWQPERNTTLKLSASKGFRAPNMRELYMYMVANEDLLPEEAWSYDFTAGHHFLDGKLNVEASLFHTTGSNIISVTVVDGKKQNHNVGEFTNNGVELSADWKAMKNLTLNANYSFLHMDTIYTGAPEHKLYAGINWTPGNLSVNIGAMGISGLYLSTGENAVKSSYVDMNARIAYRLFDYFTVFVRGTNLLNQSYMTMMGFPEPGITVLGGIELKI